MSDDTLNVSDQEGQTHAEAEQDHPGFPRMDDELFKWDVDWQYNACINFARPDRNAYIRGYRQAADKLCSVVGEERTYLDTFVYPIVFLYRHCIELHLKTNLFYARRLFEVTDHEKKHGHKLLSIWKEGRPLFERACADEKHGLDYNPFDAAEKVIGQIEATDPFATAFRYEVDNKDKHSLPKTKHINIRNLYEVMQRLISLLEGIGDVVYRDLQAKAEYEAEIQKEYEAEMRAEMERDYRG